MEPDCLIHVDGLGLEEGGLRRELLMERTCMFDCKIYQSETGGARKQHCLP